MSSPATPDMNAAGPGSGRKPVLEVVIDALADRVVAPALDDGRLPNFRALVDRGGVRHECVSIFPSITPAATCALATGEYPDRTHIAGAYWWDKEDGSVAYYGDDIWAILAESPGDFFSDFQIGLNFHRLEAPTVFERLMESGKRCAALNSMWFRGPVPHDVHTPFLLKIIPGVDPAEELTGPDILALGDFVRPTLPGDDESLPARGGMTKKFGFSDAVTGPDLLDLFAKRPLPDYTLAYFPDNDFMSHADGPHQALECLENIDSMLGELYDLFGGVDGFLGACSIVITGDHSQSDTHEDQDEREIELDEVLADLNPAPAGEPWGDDNRVMACPNMRTAQIYFRPESGPDTTELATAKLLGERKIDQVIRRDGDGADDGTGDGTGDERGSSGGFLVLTADRGELHFKPDAAGTPDRHGNRWAWEGNLAAVDGRVTDGVLEFPGYPNAFERIATSFFHESGALWATARLGHEFRLPRTSTHPGGSHATLHALDSTAPLIYAGLPDDTIVPEHPRTVDVIPMVLGLLGVDSPWKPGQGRVNAGGS